MRRSCYGESAQWFHRTDVCHASEMKVAAGAVDASVTLPNRRVWLNRRAYGKGFVYAGFYIGLCLLGACTI